MDERYQKIFTSVKDQKGISEETRTKLMSIVTSSALLDGMLKDLVSNLSRTSVMEQLYIASIMTLLKTVNPIKSDPGNNK